MAKVTKSLDELNEAVSGLDGKELALTPTGTLEADLAKVVLEQKDSITGAKLQTGYNDGGLYIYDYDPVGALRTAVEIKDGDVTLSSGNVVPTSNDGLTTKAYVDNVPYSLVISGHSPSVNTTNSSSVFSGLSALGTMNGTKIGSILTVSSTFTFSIASPITDANLYLTLPAGITLQSTNAGGGGSCHKDDGTSTSVEVRTVIIGADHLLRLNFESLDASVNYTVSYICMGHVN